MTRVVGRVVDTPDGTFLEPVDSSVVALSRAAQMLAEARTLPEVKAIRDEVASLRDWARRRHLGREAVLPAAELTLSAEHKAGGMLRQTAKSRARQTGGKPSSETMVTPRLADLGITPDQSSQWQQLNEKLPESELAAYLEAVRKSSEEDWPSEAGAFRFAERGELAPVMSSATPDWYTPAHVIAAVVAAMGGIDLDPCAEPAKRVPALNHFTEADNGLAQLWHGRVYMNPPYGKTIGEWVDKLADEFEAEHVSEAIALVPARTDTSWWAHLPASMVCFITGRLSFSEHENPAPFPSAACYLGPNDRAFADAFLRLGLVYVRLEIAA